MRTVWRKVMRFVMHALLFCCMALAFSGCASMEMKGTPFYTGEYEKRNGPVEDRVNVWPLMYYRDPALSVAWPIVELTDDHFAVRPLMSVYGLGQKDKTYNFLWPLGQFDRKSGDSRLFPVFWGHDYFTVFPLYWHTKHPLSGNGYDCLFPLWSLDVDGSGYDFYFPSFLGHIKNNASGKGWHLWPLAGNYSSNDRRYRFLFWPLGHQWSSMGGKKNGDTLIPFYLRREDQDSSSFFSLPWSCGTTAGGVSWKLAPPLFYQSSDQGGSRFLSLLYSKGHDASYTDEWSLLMPLYYSKKSGSDRTVATLLGGYKKSGDSSCWLALPLLSGGTAGPDRGSIWGGGPLAHAGWDCDSSSHHIFPLYYHSSDAAGSKFLSLPWSTSSDKRGNGWQFVPPLFFREKDEFGDMLVTPLYSRGSAEGGKKRWSLTVPLFFERETEGEKLTATLLGGYSSDANGRNWLIYPLLSGGRRGADCGDMWLLAPIFHARWSTNSISHHLMPLYYWDGEDRTLVSPIVARWKNGNGRQYTVVPPALSMYENDGVSSSLYSLGGISRFGWGRDPGAQYLLPLFYSDRSNGVFVSAAYARWRSEAGKITSMIPPALSWMSQDDRRSDLWIGGPLAHFSWGERAGSQHIFPLYYSDRASDTVISLPLMKWKSGNRKTTVIPPLLSGYSTDGTDLDITGMLGLFQNNWEPDASKRNGYLFPVYYYGDRKLYTPLFGWKNEPDDEFFYPLTPLVGVLKGNHSGGWLFPLFSHNREVHSGRVQGTFLWGQYWREGRATGSGIFPVYGYWNDGMPAADLTAKDFGDYGKTFISLPVCWYRNRLDVRRGQGDKPVVTSHKSNGIFPLWSYSNVETATNRTGDVDASLLFAVYDYKRELRPAKNEPIGQDEYTRSRVLWHLWHYERWNDDVTVDVFPAITYDRKGDGFKKVSFLWRFFRYERDGAGRKLDLMFLPIVRSGVK